MPYSISKEGARQEVVGPQEQPPHPLLSIKDLLPPSRTPLNNCESGPNSPAQLEQGIYSLSDVRTAVADNIRPLSEALAYIGPECRFLCFGEYHLPLQHDSYRLTVAKSLSTLKSRGFDTLVVELDRAKQEAVDNLGGSTDPTALRTALRQIQPFAWSAGNIEIVAQGIERGFRIVCPDIDHPWMRDQRCNNAPFQNHRDSQIANYMLEHVGPGSRAVVFYGGAHVQKHVCESYGGEKLLEWLQD